MIWSKRVSTYSDKTTHPNVVSLVVVCSAVFTYKTKSSVREETPVKYAEFIEDCFPWFVPGLCCVCEQHPSPQFWVSRDQQQQQPHQLAAVWQRSAETKVHHRRPGESHQLQQTLHYVPKIMKMCQISNPSQCKEIFVPPLIISLLFWLIGQSDFHK